MKDLFLLTGTESREKMVSGEITAKALTESCLDRIEATDSKLKAWVCYDREKALTQAARVDKKIASKQPIGKLAGLSVGVKDVFNTADFPTCMGSPIWKGFTPGNDARTVFYIRQEDAVVPGKTTTAEFAVHAPAETVNPHNPAYSPGTSSSGSAAAVATYQVPLAFGTQTAGSIIRPASYCGVIGYKPSFAVIPRTGALKTTDSLDTIGMFARSVDDIELLFGVMRVSGPNFPFVQNFLENPEFQSKKLGEPWKVLLITDQLQVWENADPYAKEAIQQFAKNLAKNGVVVETPKLPDSFNKAHDIHSIIYDKTLAYYFKEEHKQHTLISKVMHEIISRGQALTLDQYKQALEDQSALIREAEKILSQYDAIITLSTTGEAPKFGGDDRPDSALIWTLCQAPSLNLPVFTSPNQMPFGLQLIGRKYTDYKLLNFARFIEKKFASDFYLKRKESGVLSSR